MRQLRSYQQNLREQAASRNLLAALQPGTGKTAVGLHWLRDGMADGRFRRPLLVAPKLLLKSVWEPEVEHWPECSELNFRHLSHASTAKRSALLDDRPDNCVIACTPEGFAWIVEETIRRKRVLFDAIVIDEAQKFNSIKSTRSQALRTLLAKMNLPQGRILWLTGSPTPNGPIDAWTVGHILTGGAEPWGAKPYVWRSRHFTAPPRDRFVWTPKAGTEAAVNAELAKIGVSVTLGDATDVPAMLTSELPLQVDEDMVKCYKHLIREGWTCLPCGSVREPESTGEIIQLMTQMSSGFAYHGTEGVLYCDARLQAAVDFVADERPHPVLIPIRYRFEAELLRDRIPGAVVISGDTSQTERLRIIDAWNANRIPALILSPKAAGHGLNLQFSECRTVLWYGLPFSHELYTQTNARIVRSGQHRVVSVVRMVAEETIDSAYVAVLDRKASGEAALLSHLNLPPRKKIV